MTRTEINRLFKLLKKSNIETVKAVFITAACDLITEYHMSEQEVIAFLELNLDRR